ncbi:hypothetical protein [Bdellovibrio sp. HCB209]|uniref:hypothetical protein n=1 Tax=Bdellovibrio sp. HCB209 TaxID=3394354 RepID=UPI0039B6CA7C
MKSVIIALTLLGSVSAFAQGAPKEHPCNQVKAACEGAGFKKGEQKDGKGLWKDCIDPIMKGKPVAGVTLTKEAIDACKDKHISTK